MRLPTSGLRWVSLGLPLPTVNPDPPTVALHSHSLLLKAMELYIIFNWRTVPSRLLSLFPMGMGLLFF